MKKVLFVATVVKTHIMEFHIPYLKMFKDMGWYTAVAARNDYEDPAQCTIPYCDTYYDIPFERNPVKPLNITAYIKLKHLIDQEQFDIIHCHTPVGGMLARLAGRRARKDGTKIFYTAHGFHFYSGAPKVNWMLYCPVEWYLSKYTDVLITINEEDYHRASGFRAKSVQYIPGVGIDLEKFIPGYTDPLMKRNQMGISQDSFFVMAYGRPDTDDTYQELLDTVARLNQDRTSGRIQLMFHENGQNKTDLENLAKNTGIEKDILFLENRADLAEIWNCTDLLIAMEDEQTPAKYVMEAEAWGIPVLYSDGRTATDQEKLDKNIENRLESTIRQLQMDQELRDQLGSAVLHCVRKTDLHPFEKDTECKALQAWMKGQKLRQELNIPLDAKVILSVGEVNKNKNHEVGIRALAELNNRNVYYVICGSGPLMQDLKSLAQSLGVEDRVMFAGYRTDVPDFYQMADIFLFPSFREGLPVAVMEAMASGLPVLCGKIRGCCDLITENENGWFFRMNDTDDCADKLRKAIDLPQSAIPLRNRRKAYNYSIDSITELYKSAYGIEHIHKG